MDRDANTTVDNEFGQILERRLIRRRFNNPLEAAGELEDVILDVFQELRGVLPSKDQVLVTVGSIYDRFIAPIDIPGIPNLIEPMVDALLRRYLLSAVGALYDRFIGAS